MAVMDALLIQPNYQRARKSGAWGVNPPLGLAYIAAVLEHKGFSVNILDANALGLTEAQVVASIRAKKPRIVGISMLTPAHSYCVNIARSFKSEGLLVAGGPHATSSPELLLHEGFDVVVRGEGEYAMLDLAQQKDVKTINGISYVQDGAVKHNPDREFISDLDSLPYPARHLLPSCGVDVPYLSAGTRHRPWAPVFTSRGCPYQCYYCNKNIFGYKWRPRSARSVVDEMEFLVKNYGVKEIDIVDDLFNFNLERAEKICDLLIERKLNIHLRCSNGVRVDKITESLLEKMKKAGWYYLAFGIESGSQDVLNKIPKNITLEQVRTAVRLAKQKGFEVTGFFIFGLIGDTPKSMRETIEFAKSLDLDIASFNICAPYPGTKLWMMIQTNGKLLLDNYDDFHHTANRGLFMHPDVASPDEVEKAYRQAHREFYFRSKYVLKRIVKTRSLSQYKEMYRGLKTLLHIQRD
jgi:radical SAM superfamily enzyme YgiQ (UPF0313 family)